MEFEKMTRYEIEKTRAKNSQAGPPNPEIMSRISFACNVFVETCPLEIG
jgi:hypothetical protein